MAKTYYTVLVVPDRSSKTARFRVPRGLLVRLAVVAVLLMIGSIAAMFHYAHVVSQSADDRVIK